MEFINFIFNINIKKYKYPNNFTLPPIEIAQYLNICNTMHIFWKNNTTINSLSQEEDYQEFVTLVVADPTLCYVVWDENQPSALLFCRVANGCGVMDQIIVAPQYWCQVLVLNALASLYRQGIQRIRLFTDANNQYGARSLAEKVGFNAVKTFSQYCKPI